MKRQIALHVRRVHGDLVLCIRVIANLNQTFVVGERDIGGSCAISMIVRNDL